VVFCQTVCRFGLLELRWGLFLWFLQQTNDLYEESTIKQQDPKRITQGNGHNTSDLNYLLITDLNTIEEQI
jgi:hypothetical protein